MSSRPVRRMISTRLLVTLPTLFLAFSCVDLTPPWEKNRGLDAGKDVPQTLDTNGNGGTSGGSGGVGGTGGSGGTGDSGRSSASEQGDAAAPSIDTAVLDSKSEIDVPPAPEADARDAPVLPPDNRLSDARNDWYGIEGGGTGVSGGDAAKDATSGTGGAGGGGAGASGGTTTGGTGGMTTGGSSTGGSGGSAIPDAGSSPVDGGLSYRLVAYYPCDQAAGPTLTDQSGNKRDGTAFGGYSFSPGKFERGLAFTVADKGYAKLPSDLLTNTNEATIATWVYSNSNTPVWQRIWDFGKDQNVYMFLTTNNFLNRLRFSISINGNQNESGLQTDLLPEKVWKHVAVVLGSSNTALYVDGQQVAASSSITLRPDDLGSSLNYYIGRSQFPEDPYFDGRIDGFRIYNRALSAQEVQALFLGP